jgi:hypothetical protein
MIGSQLLGAPDPKQSSSHGRTLVRWVKAGEATWHRGSMEVMASQTPRHATQGDDFGGLTRCSQEPRGVHLQWSNHSNPSMGFEPMPTTIHYPS